MHEELEGLDNISPAELARLFAKHGPGLTDAQLSQTRAPLKCLQIAPLVFQPRNMQEKPWEKERHIENLAKIVRLSKSTLDPIVVFPVDGSRIVVDGHCRRDAYLKAKRKASTMVAVKHLRGTFAEALAYSAASNSKDKLALSYFEKAEKAWQLVKFNEGRDCYSGRDVGRATGISKSTVFNMHNRLTRADAAEIRQLRWREVLSRDRGDEAKPYDDDWEETTANEWAVRLRKHFGEKPNAQPLVFRRALELAYQWELSRGDDWDLEGDEAEEQGESCDF